MTSLVGLPAPLSRPEEWANSITHGLGFALSLVGTGHLLSVASQYGDSWQFVGVSIYGATLLALYAASTLSHSFEKPTVRHFFRSVDQVCIFLLIAGTFTPIALTYLREGWWSAVLISMWTLALVGIFVKLFLTRLNNVAISAYVLLGWFPAIAIKPILASMPVPSLWMMLAGGLCYTIGTWFLMRDDRVPYFHAVWHVCVIAGSACHYMAVLGLLEPTT